MHSYGIATLATILILVIEIMSYNNIRNDRTLSKIQSNLINNYVRVSNQFGVAFYKWFGVAFYVAMAWYGLTIGAWVSTIIFILHIYFANRTHTLVRATKFVETDAAGQAQVKGGYLSPVKSHAPPTAPATFPSVG